MLKRTVTILGFKIDLYDFGYAKYMYPQFNGDAEFEISRKGYKKLTHYLRNIIWMQNRMPKYTF
jgi:hypothetical protein